MMIRRAFTCRVRRLSTYRMAEMYLSYLTFSINETPVILGRVKTLPYFLLEHAAA